MLCFETPWSRNFRHPAELIGDVFRCLVAMFQNQEKTVITPLLSTGDQVSVFYQHYEEHDDCRLTHAHLNHGVFLLLKVKMNLDVRTFVGEII